MATSLTPGEAVEQPTLVDIVTKNSSDRLREELARGQDTINPEGVASLERPALIAAVVALRTQAGQNTPVRTIVPNFRFETPVVGVVQPVVLPAPLVIDPVAAMLQAMQQQNALLMMQLQQAAAERKEQAEQAARKEDMRAEQAAADRKVQAEQAERAAAERREQVEQAAAERKENLLLEQRRLDDALAERRWQAEQVTAERKLQADQALLSEQRRMEQIEEHRVAHAKQLSIISDRQAATDKAVADAATERAADRLRFENRLARAGKLMSKLLYPMPDTPSEVVCYLKDIETIFARNSVDDDLRVSLLTPQLNRHIRRLMALTPAEDVNDYAKLKARILLEFHASADTHKQSFNEAIRMPHETVVQFTSRLRVLFDSYMEARKVDTLPQLVDLILLDRLKGTLTSQQKFFLSDREIADPTLDLPKITLLIDTHESMFGRPQRRFQRNFGHAQGREFQPQGRDFQAQGSDPRQSRNMEVKKPYQQADRSRLQCTRCGRSGHVNATCYVTLNKAAPANKQQPKVTRVQACNVVADVNVVDKANVQTRSKRYRRQFQNSNVNSNRVNAIQSQTVSPSSCAESSATGCPDSKPVGVRRMCPVAPAVTYMPPRPGKDSVPLRRETCDDGSSLSDRLHANDRTVSVDFGRGPVICRIDTGCELSVLSTSVVDPRVMKSAHNRVTLQGAFGDPIGAALVNVDATLVDEQGRPGRTVMLACAVTDVLRQDHALITLDDFEALVGFASAHRVDEVSGSNVAYSDPALSLEADACRRAEVLATTVRGQLIPTQIQPDSILDAVGFDKCSQSQFASMQKQDTTLASCWAESEKTGSPFTVVNGVLFHDAVCGGLGVRQLVVPAEKRKQIMSVAHDTLWAMHFASSKTAQRILAHFYWPRLQRDVDQYVQTCDNCQLRSRRTKRDRVPIQAVDRPEHPFEICQVDVIGPFETKSAKGHAYVLTLICMSTKYPYAEPLKGLTSKETCDALMRIFCHTGIPRVIVSDNGTNFVSCGCLQLMDNLGIEVRHATPAHPQANGGIERFNQTFKAMLHHIMVSDSPRSWHEKIPYLLFAYRELPHCTTGFSPHTMVFGSPARGVLAALRDTWSGRESPSRKLTSSAKEYLDLLQTVLQEIQTAATLNCKQAQDSYVTYHNTHARDKSFVVGEQVLILQPSSANKTLSQWVGPGAVVAVISPYSYNVSLNNGAIRNCHANNLRKFHTRACMVGVLVEEDDEIDPTHSIETYPPDRQSFEENLSRVDLSHLPENNRADLVKLLRKHSAVFNDEPGLCNMAQHEINMVPGFVPKAQRPYRIPQKLQAEVDRQLEIMLSTNKIQRSSSAYAHPIVCVTKKSGEIRICADLRYVNSGTVPDSYPMANPDELLLEISPSKVISTLDCSQGYYQIPLRPEDRHKTAFVTNSGLWEYLVLPFGIRTASATFQRTIEAILRPRCASFARPYIDDVAVHSPTFEKHLSQLSKVLTDVANAGLTLKLAKCTFAKPKVKFVGHLVGSGTREPLADKVQAIRDIQEPTTKRALRSFLGCAGFYRTYISRYADVCVPLTDLTKSHVNSKIRFNDVERAAFNKIKQKLADSVALHAPDYSKPFVIHADASDVAVGCVLSQEDSTGNALVPIAFASKKFSDTERRWGASVREAYSVLYSLGHWEYMIWGHEITLYSDNNPLHFIAQSASSSPKLTRWSLALQRYQVTVKPIRGSSNLVADMLSRHCI
jgi:chemotaxis protein histidine kinase CheA